VILKGKKKEKEKSVKEIDVASFFKVGCGK
jgi:hypothetical protein